MSYPQQQPTYGQQPYGGGQPQQYGTPPQEYGTPAQEYAGPPQQYGAPPQQRGGGGQVYGTPVQQQAPAQQQAPGQHYRAPAQQYGAPPQHYAPPQQPHYGQPQHAQQPHYGQPQHAQHAQHAHHGYEQVDTSVRCRFCGSVPAAKATFRGHQGMIIIMRFLSLEGPYCRDCGLATFRSMTARTLVQGWYGYASFVITPITVLINLVRRGRVAKLPAPRPAPDGNSQRPMDPGAPLLTRPTAIIGLAIPFALVLLLITLIVASSSS